MTDKLLTVEEPPAGWVRRCGFLRRLIAERRIAVRSLAGPRLRPGWRPAHGPAHVLEQGRCEPLSGPG